MAPDKGAHSATKEVVIEKLNTYHKVEVLSLKSY
jgi:hypothetical protein